MNELHTETVMLKLTPSLLKEIEEWQHDNHISNRNEAIRILLRKALEIKG